MKNKLGIILDQTDINTIEFNKDTINEFSKLLDNVRIIDVSEIVKTNHLDKNSKILNKLKIENMIYLKPLNYNELKKILSEKKFVYMYCLNNSLKYFQINHLISKTKIKKFIVSNLGYNPENFNFHQKQSIFKKIILFLNLRFTYYLKRFLILLNILPKIDFFFEASSFVINSIENGISRKISKKIPWLNFSYYKNVIKINSRFYDEILRNDHAISNKYITFIDGMLFEHKDRIYREGKPNTKSRESYFNSLNFFLEKLSEKYQKKVIICLHPFNFSDQKKDFPNFECVKYKTMEYINQAEIVVFHEGSSIIQAVALKKKIINLYGNFLGDYINKRCEMYSNLLNLKRYNLEKFSIEKLDVLDANLHERTRSYDNYISENIIYKKNITSSEQIVEYLNQID